MSENVKVETISDLIKSLERAKSEIGNVTPMVGWSVGSRKMWPILHVAHGILDGEPYCQLTTGLTDDSGEGDADMRRMAEEFIAAAAELNKEVK